MIRRAAKMRDRLIICNDDGIQMLHHSVPERVEQSIRDWVDFFLAQCHIDIFSLCTAFPDKTHHETTVGERYFSNMDVAPSQSQLHNKQSLDELATAPAPRGNSPARERSWHVGRVCA